MEVASNFVPRGFYYFYFRKPLPLFVTGCCHSFFQCGIGTWMCCPATQVLGLCGIAIVGFKGLGKASFCVHMACCLINQMSLHHTSSYLQYMAAHPVPPSILPLVIPTPSILPTCPLALTHPPTTFHLLVLAPQDDSTFLPADPSTP